MIFLFASLQAEDSGLLSQSPGRRRHLHDPSVDWHGAHKRGRSVQWRVGRHHPKSCQTGSVWEDCSTPKTPMKFLTFLEVYCSFTPLSASRVIHWRYASLLSRISQVSKLWGFEGSIELLYVLKSFCMRFERSSHLWVIGA